MALIDMHCHLDLYPRPEEIAQECLNRGMYVLAVTTLPSVYSRSKNLTIGKARMRTALGFHPELVAERLSEIDVFEDYIHDTDYVGEVGLDGSAKHRHSLGIQQEFLIHILELCSRHRKKAISLHSRGASKLLLDAIETYPDAGRFLLHWFTASKREIQRAIELDCWFSISPAMINSTTGRAAVDHMPLNRILLESDGPLAQYEGHDTLPWQTEKVLSYLAYTRAERPEQIAKVMLHNLRNMSTETAPTTCSPSGRT